MDRHKQPSKRILSLLIAAIVLCHYSQGQSPMISPKLDFGDTNEMDRNTSASNLYPGSRNNDNNRNNNDNNDTRHDGGGTGPRIHGVRVTVDTGGNSQNSKEKQESSEIIISGKGTNKKRVGIHTDITLDITADVLGAANTTTSSESEDKEDASVPIFKGRNDPAHKSRKHPGSHARRHPNVSVEGRRDFTYFNWPNPTYSRYPSYNVPAYPDPNQGKTGGNAIYRDHNPNWTGYLPVSTHWTTERSYYEPYRPNVVTRQQEQSWKPCYCAENRARRNSVQSPIIQIIDDKLKRPFSNNYGSSII